jgi:hypothetical protein
MLLDIETTRPGIDFVAAAQDAVAQSDLMICLIGRQWLRIEDDHGRRMLENPEDPVRVQIATALAKGIPILPVLVRDAPMPNSAELPADLKGLARLQSFSLSDRVGGDLKMLGELVEVFLHPKKGGKDSARLYRKPPGPGDTGPSPVLLPPVQAITPPNETCIAKWKGMVNFEESYPARIRSITSVHKGAGDDLAEDFLGEIGVEAALYHDPTGHTNPLTLEVWLFDRLKLAATTLVISSPAAASDPTTMLRAARRGKIVPSAGEMRFAIETETLYAEVGVSQMQYSGDVAHLYIRSAHFEFRVWRKEDLATPA